MQQEVVTVGLDLAKNVFQVHATACRLAQRRSGVSYCRRTEVIRFFANCRLAWSAWLEVCASARRRWRAS
jgi:transposase